MDILLRVLFSFSGALSIVYAMTIIVPKFKEGPTRRHLTTAVLLAILLNFIDLSQLNGTLLLSGVLILMLRFFYGNTTFVSAISVLFWYLIFILSSMISANVELLIFRQLFDFRKLFILPHVSSAILYWVMLFFVLKYYQLIMRIFRKITTFNQMYGRSLLVSNLLVFTLILFCQRFNFSSLVQIVSSGLLSSLPVIMYVILNYLISTILTLSVVVLINRLFIVDNNLENYKYKAETDQMTGVLSREAGLSHLRTEMMSASLRKYDLTIAYIDINDLKVVNDRYGHHEGDRLIKAVTDIVQKNLREFDIIARLGGDEFMLVFRKCNLFQAKKVWNRINEEFIEANVEGIYPFKVSASIGFRQYESEHHPDVMQLVHEADKAMYVHKKRLKASKL